MTDMKKYTVLLLYPPYFTAEEVETFYAWVEAEDATEAVKAGQAEAYGVNDEVADIPEDFIPLAVIEGHIELELGVSDFQ